MAFYIYRIFSNFLSVFIIIFFAWRFLNSKENKNSIIDKFTINQKDRPKGKLIWINAVSIGEAKSGMIIADELIKKNPNINILFSTSTLSSFKLISKLNKRLILIYSPIDISFVVKRFIDHWKPDLSIFLESEIWPNMINYLKKNKINLTIINGRISNKSFKIWKKISFFSQKIFKSIDICLVQDSFSQHRFKNLGTKNVQLIGNLKFLSKKPEVNQKDFFSLKKQLMGKRIITMFSTHENEEKYLIYCLKQLKKKYKNIFFIIIPRHLHRAEKIKYSLKKHNVKFALRSINKSSIKEKEFYIVDSFGELPLFFKLSEITIVGGSFTNKGGHNPIETSHFKCALIFGPFMQNFSNIEKTILKKNAGFKVKNSKQLSDKITLLLSNRKKKNEVINNFKKVCKNESKKARLIFNNLQKFL